MTTRSSLRRQVNRLLPSTTGLALARTSLKEAGWVRSAVLGQPVDKHGEPVPWLSYAALHLLERLPTSGLRVFEYGSGNSTVWWSRRADQVVAVEHDESWAESVAARSPGNVRVLVEPIGQSYVEAVRSHGPFDVVVVDGRERSRCAAEAARNLTGHGVIVWDDTQRSRYQEGLRELTAAGFRQVPLFGLGPHGTRFGTTTILYRDGNLLGL